jgi:hypothetical protein
MTAEKYKDPASGESRIVGYGDAAGVYDVPLSAVLSVLDDPVGASSYSPRLLESRLELRDGSRLVIFQFVGFSFLGIKLGYRFRAEQVRDDLSKGEVGYRVRLLESLDGTFFEAYTSWYAKQVMVDGREMVFLRTYTRPGLRKPALGMEGILKTFTPPELKGTLNRVVKEARRRAAAK